MADRHQRLSHHLWKILDRSGVSESMRAASRHRSLVMEIASTASKRLKYNINVSEYVFGSSCEGATTPGLKSDIDNVFVNETHPVVNNLRYAGADLCQWLTWDSITVPGYVKLQLVYNGTPLDIHTKPLDVTGYTTRFDNAGRLVLANSVNGLMYMPYMSLPNIQHVARHGPAMRIQRISSIDMVYALRCTSWPHIATEWLHRKREHNWPPSNMIDKAKTMGCLFVPVGHPDSCEEDLEWRLSLSLQERQLMFYLNDVQHKCYVLLKLIKSDIIEADIKGDSITSYHLKTCLFYCIERTRADFWQRDNLVRCLIYCLGTLLHWLRHGYCPHYFIKEQNMFRGKLDRQVRERCLRLLYGILSGICRFLLKIESDDIGKQLLMAYSSERNIDTDVMLKTFIYEHKMYMDTSVDLQTIATHLLGDFPSRNMDIALCIQSHETLLHKLYRMKTLSQHSETETEKRTAIQGITPLIHTSLACHMVIQVLQTTGSRMSIYNSNTPIQEHLSKGLEFDPLSSRLKHLAIYYRLADYENVELILNRAKNYCFPSVCNVCTCVCGITTYWTYWYIIPWSRSTKMQVCFCVRFLLTEIDITPTPLQYEMFRYVGTHIRPPSPDDQINVRHDVAAVDATVFLHFMWYLVYSKKHDNSRKDLALELLESTITTHVDELFHKETAWNILGWIHRQEHNTSNAMECFKKSMSLEPLHNAAIWQIAELCFEQLTNTHA